MLAASADHSLPLDDYEYERKTFKNTHLTNTSVATIEACGRRKMVSNNDHKILHLFESCYSDEVSRIHDQEIGSMYIQHFTSVKTFLINRIISIRNNENYLICE